MRAQRFRDRSRARDSARRNDPQQRFDERGHRYEGRERERTRSRHDAEGVAPPRSGSDSRRPDRVGPRRRAFERFDGDASGALDESERAALKRMIRELRAERSARGQPGREPAVE